MKIGCLSDELSPAPRLACELAALYGLDYLELRMWFNHRAPLGMREADMLETRKIADEWGLSYPSISPGLFKLPPDSTERERHAGELFERSLDLCEVLGAKVMVSFTPIVPEEDRGKWDGRLLEEFRAMGEQAQARGVTIAIENEPVCVASSAPLVAQLVSEIRHPAVKMNYDPGNDASSGQSTGPQAFPVVKPHLVHVHVKDYVRGVGGHRVADVGEGDSDWRYILRQLRDISYSGLLILEPHNVPQMVSSQRAVLALRRLLAETGVEW
ncbi:MAG TPA: sugar phosphate isomerase/epimerase family protein [Armatimonadota bacterium]|jgi:sugar phosphate isomerase/epimerase